MENELDNEPIEPLWGVEVDVSKVSDKGICSLWVHRNSDAIELTLDTDENSEICITIGPEQAQDLIQKLQELVKCIEGGLDGD